MTQEHSVPAYWARLVKCLRATLRLSQAELSERLGVDQATVSRWERGLNEPHYEPRKILDDMAKDAGLATLEDMGNLVNASPFPMILVGRGQVVFAASASSGFDPHRPVAEQTPPEERSFLQDFAEQLQASGFWAGLCSRFDYEFHAGTEIRRAVVTAVTIRGEIFALVQKAW